MIYFHFKHIVIRRNHGLKLKVITEELKEKKVQLKIEREDTGYMVIIWIRLSKNVKRLKEKYVTKLNESGILGLTPQSSI